MSHEEFPKVDNEREERDNQTFKEYVDHLNLRVEELHGLRILDVGAGDGGFVRRANHHGAYAIGIDNGDNISPEVLRYIQKTRTPFVLAHAAALPFDDDTFDLVVSHAAIPNIVGLKPTYVSRRDLHNSPIEEQKIRIKSLREMLRVVKPGREVRCAPVIGEHPDHGKQQSDAIRDAISTIHLESQTQEEPLKHGCFRLILKKEECSKDRTLKSGE